MTTTTDTYVLPFEIKITIDSQNVNLKQNKGEKKKIHNIKVLRHSQTTVV